MSDQDLHTILRETGIAPAAFRAIIGAVQATVRAEVATLHARIGEANLTMEEAAARAKCSKQTIRRRVRDGLLRPVPGPKRPMFHPREIDRALREGVL